MINLEQEIGRVIRKFINDSGTECDVPAGLFSFEAPQAFKDIMYILLQGEEAYECWFSDKTWNDWLEFGNLEIKIKETCEKYDKSMLLTSNLKYIRDLAEKM